MPARLLNALREHARETHPEECCGLLLGPEPGAHRDFRRCRNDMTRLHQQDPVTYPRDGRQAFHMSESDYLRVLNEADERGWCVTAVVHSHADAAAYFSELDQRFATQPGFPFPSADHVVVSVVDGLVKEAAVFRATAEAPGFEGRLLVSEAP
jgi:proteasome lid subunit RPN8/RPN11